MESRKYHLQKQILEAKKSNDNDLLSLLNSQWAHRYGVESLDELNNQDLNQLEQNPSQEDNQKIEQSFDNLSDEGELLFTKEDNDKNDNQEKDIIKDNQKVDEAVEKNLGNSYKSHSYEIVQNEKRENKVIESSFSIKSVPEIQALIPLPPKARYGYLQKWVRIKF